MTDISSPADKLAATALNRSAAVAKTWADPAVAASRSARHQVTVGKLQYRSVGAAFEALGLAEMLH